MPRPFLRRVYPHPVHPGPDWFSPRELAFWDAELLAWGVREGLWRPIPFGPTPAGERLLDGFLNYYSTRFPSTFTDHYRGELLLYMKQIVWASPGETDIETEERLAHLHHQFGRAINEPRSEGHFEPFLHYPNDCDRNTAEEGS